MADLVDDGVADFADGFAAGLAAPQDGAAEDGDLGGLDTALAPGDVVAIMPAVSGG